MGDGLELSLATAANLPTSSIEQLLVNARSALVDLSHGLRHLEPEDINGLLPDLEELTRLLSGINDRSRSYCQVYDKKGQVKPGCIVVKTINNCGPYGYLVTSIGGGKRSWEYLGKAEKGTATGVYAPGTSLQFTARRERAFSKENEDVEGGESKN